MVIYGDFGDERELHCGDYFEAWLGLGGTWVGTTIEKIEDEWYCSARGLSLVDMIGCIVRYDNDLKLRYHG